MVGWLVAWRKSKWPRPAPRPPPPSKTLASPQPHLTHPSKNRSGRWPLPTKVQPTDRQSNHPTANQPGPAWSACRAPRATRAGGSARTGGPKVGSASRVHLNSHFNLFHADHYFLSIRASLQAGSPSNGPLPFNLPRPSFIGKPGSRRIMHGPWLNPADAPAAPTRPGPEGRPLRHPPTALTAT
jgi:hypothetical protein